MGNVQTNGLTRCIDQVCAGRTDCATYSGSSSYNSSWVQLYNLDKPVVPAAIIRPETAEDVAGVVRCAASHQYKVQAKSGGHSFEYVLVLIPQIYSRLLMVVQEFRYVIIK
jgi:hypothetical protein